MMDQHLKDEWVRRLRSGNYAQGTRWLRTLDEKYCCLGVLCEMAVEQGIVSKELVPSETALPPRYRYVSNDGTYKQSDLEGLFPHVGSDNCLPLGVVRWAGLEEITPTVRDGYTSWSLTQMNDSGKTFSEIADTIEKGRI